MLERDREIDIFSYITNIVHFDTNKEVPSGFMFEERGDIGREQIVVQKI